jgi:hypothetical protein
MSIDVVIGINASEDRVWSVLTDVERWREWTASMTSVIRVDSGPLVVGSKARIKQPRLGTLVWTVTELSPRRSFVWEAKRPGLTLVAGHHIDIAGPSSVNLTLSVELRGLVAGVFEPLGKRTVRRSIQLEAEGHKRRAESPD